MCSLGRHKNAIISPGSLSSAGKDEARLKIWLETEKTLRGDEGIVRTIKGKEKIFMIWQMHQITDSPSLLVYGNIAGTLAA